LPRCGGQYEEFAADVTRAAPVKRIVALPVDGRPVVREQVAMLVAAADWELIVPPVTALGHFRDAADRDQLAAWLLAQAPTADGFVLSIDMLVYGGLVPSRFIADPLAQLIARLDVITLLKTRFPEKPIYAFAATMRLSNNNFNEEEKSYWDKYGSLIWQWSFYGDRFNTHQRDTDAQKSREAYNLIPEEIRDDYLATRERNFSVTTEALAMVERGMIDRLILPQDDTAEYGFNIAERIKLQDQVSQRNLRDRVLIYPGADEVIHTLCARMVQVTEQRVALTFYLHCSDPAGFGRLHALYEDRPVLDSIASQIGAAGGELAQAPDTADIIVAVHTCGIAQGDWAMKKPLPEPQEISKGWLADLALFRESGKPIAVLDLAYANGGDPALIAALSPVVPLNALAAYAGWNTASNSVGNLAAQCVLSHGRYGTAANRRLLALRLLEDYFYQAVQRQIIRAAIDESALSAEALNAAVAGRFVEPANLWAAEHQLGFRVASVSMPWHRTFEIDIQVERAELTAPQKSIN
jgi:Protein of unknown function (DUF4127)